MRQSAKAKMSPAAEEIHREACKRNMDWYIDPDTGFHVFTEVAHKRRGYCCGNTCRHCPYGFINVGRKPDPHVHYHHNDDRKKGGGGRSGGGGGGGGGAARLKPVSNNRTNSSPPPHSLPTNDKDKTNRQLSTSTTTNSVVAPWVLVAGSRPPHQQLLPSLTPSLESLSKLLAPRWPLSCPLAGLVRPRLLPPTKTNLPLTEVPSRAALYHYLRRWLSFSHETASLTNLVRRLLL